MTIENQCKYVNHHMQCLLKNVRFVFSWSNINKPFDIPNRSAQIYINSFRVMKKTFRNFKKTLKNKKRRITRYFSTLYEAIRWHWAKDTGIMLFGLEIVYRGGWLSCYVVRLVVSSLCAVVLPGFNSRSR